MNHGSGARAQSSAVNPKHDGQAVLSRFRRCPYVEVQTILACRLAVRKLLLRTRVAKLPGVSHARPLGGRLRRLPPQTFHGRSSVRNTFEDVDLLAVTLDAGNQSAVGADRAIG